MRILLVTTLAALLLFGIWGANQHQVLGSKLPALGPLMSPYTGFWQQAESTDVLDQIDYSFPQLSDEVEVYFDERMVPHIFASDVVDASFVQGYLTAQHRLWQMDISTRASSGRLAEILGENLLERDRLQRRKGMLWAAENAIKSWKQNPQEWAIITAYAEGVNAYVATLKPADYPIEFKLLGYEPEEWTPLKSALFFKSMAETLCSRNKDIPASNTKSWLGEELFDFLYQEWNPNQSPIIPASVNWDFEPQQSIPRDTITEMLGQHIPYRTFPLPPEFIGSNNWAVAASKTKNGAPILCNDPHLNLTVPAIWYEVQIHIPEYNAYGVSLPGVPGIIIGFNKDIAWGVTNVGQDVMDWYTIEWADEQHNSYVLDGQDKEVDKLVEIINVRGRTEPVLDTVKYTYWGPVVYEEKGNEYDGMAMRWVAHDQPERIKPGVLGAFQQLMKASSYDDYYQALQGYESPGQNFVFASKTGDIALTVNGKFPVKQKEQGRFVQKGNTTQNEWQGFIPYEHLPRVKNPERAFVSSANQHSTMPDYPYYYNGGFDDWRGRLINRRLDSLSNVTIEDMMALQNESYSLKAEEGLPILLSLIDSTDTSLLQAEEVKALRQWDYRFLYDATAPVIFQKWLEKSYEYTFDEMYQRDEEEEVLFPESWRFLYLLKEYPLHDIFDDQGTSEKENARAIVSKALKEVLGEEKINWGDYQEGKVVHLGRIDAFSEPLPEVNGYADAPNAFKGSNGPSWRMVVELGDEIEAYGVYPGGQSGNPGSSFYNSMVGKWSKGEYYLLQFFEHSDEAASEALQRVRFGK